MKHKIRCIMALVLALSMLMVTGAAAASEPALSVRVNGKCISFSEGQPFITQEGCTMVPAEPITQALSAEMSWDAKANTVTIGSNDIRIDFPVDRNDVKVTKGGNEQKVTEISSAILKDGQVFIPLRFVAETLGYWVSYSKAYRTVEIWKDSLTPSEINRLHTLAPKAKGFSTLPESLRSEPFSYENVSEYTYREIKPTMDYTMSYLDKQSVRHSYSSKTDSREAFTDYVAGFLREKYSTGQYAQSEYGIQETFRTDGSCIYGFPAVGSAYVADGLLTIHADKNADVTGYRKFNSGNSLLDNLKPGETVTYLVEICYQIVLDGKGHGTISPYLTFNRTDGQFKPIYQ